MMREGNGVMRLNVIDLFCGAGGMSLGLEQAGFNIVAAMDNWDSAVDCYKNNFQGHVVHKQDLSDWREVMRIIQDTKCDMIVGGPPCQDFSEAGDRVEGDRAELTKSFAKIVAKKHPRYFIMENVPAAQKSKAYKSARAIFKRAGYGLTEVVLDASLCGVPQRRKRFFCIGSLRDKNRFLIKMLLANQSDLPMTVRDYLKDEFPFEYYYRHPRTYGRKAIFSVDEPAPTMRGINRPLPKTYKKHSSDCADPRECAIRSLDYRERARIQMFPTTYKWTQQSSINDQMVGNAVPVGLAKYVGNCLLKFIHNGNEGVPLNFTEWLCKNMHLRKEAAGDNLSRYRRAKKILSGNKYDEFSIEEALISTKEFQGLSKSIQNHLRRACELHCAYLRYLNKKQEGQNEK